MSRYPTLRLAALHQLAEVKNQLAADADFLASEECPYDNETKELLSELLAQKVVEVAVEKVVQATPGRGRPSKEIKLSEEDQQAVIDGIKATMAELDEMSKKEGLETSERIQIAKTRTSLLDQLLKMQERHYSVTKQQEFIETTIGILTDLVGEREREVMLSRLEQYR
jgi:hypothetical protein